MLPIPHPKGNQLRRRYSHFKRLALLRRLKGAARLRVGCGFASKQLFRFSSRKAWAKKRVKPEEDNFFPKKEIFSILETKDGLGNSSSY